MAEAIILIRKFRVKCLANVRIVIKLTINVNVTTGKNQKSDIFELINKPKTNKNHINVASWPKWQEHVGICGTRKCQSMKDYLFCRLNGMKNCFKKESYVRHLFYCQRIYFKEEIIIKVCL